MHERWLICGYPFPVDPCTDKVGLRFITCSWVNAFTSDHAPAVWFCVSEGLTCYIPTAYMYVYITLHDIDTHWPLKHVILLLPTCTDAVHVPM